MAKTKKEKKEKKAGKRMKKKELVKALLDFFHIKQDEVLSLKYIFEQLHLTTHPLKMLCMDILSELSDDDYITEVDKHKYKLNNHGVEMTGIFQRKSNGKNSFIPEGGGDPIFVAERNSAHAMAGDKVRIAFYAKRRGREAEGEVIEILERANDTFVGTLEVAKSYAFLVTENRTLANDIFIPKEKLKGGKTGDKAIVKVVEWPDKAKNPIGQVIDILGKAGDNTTEMHAILAEFGLPYVYPTSVEKAADKIPAEIPAEEYAKREDFRNITTFTIDPKDAKDFDDALSVRKLKDNLWEVGVHIADVTHYVTEGSIIDKEAEKRATSVYLVDRTIPMLPERLCNFICSLRPNEEKLAYSAIFEMTDKGKIKNNKKFTLKMLHFFINTGIKDTAYYWNELNKCLSVYCELKKICPDLDSLNIGGGFPIKNSLAFDYDYEYMTEEIVAQIKNICNSAGIEEPNIFTEFGSFTVGESGATLFSIINQKQQNDRESWYMIDSSFMTTLPDIWGINQRYILLAINNWDREYQRVFLGGLTCDSEDYYNGESHSNAIFLPKLLGGPQYIGFFHTGAYQESLGGFGGIQHCLIPAPKHIIIDRDKSDNEYYTRLFAKEQSYRSMMRILGY